MKRIIFITSLFFGLFLNSFAQTTPSKTLSVESKTGTSLQFSEINVSGNGPEYKSLCIKYINEQFNNQNDIDINGNRYMYFQDKKSAISHYYKTKETAGSKVTYYVYSTEKRNPEVLSIRV